MINVNSIRGSRAEGVSSREPRREVTFGKVTRWKIAVCTVFFFFERPRIGRRSARIPIERHRVGARASREWPRGEKRKGSPRVAPPAAGGGRFVSLFPSFPLILPLLFPLGLSISRSLFLAPSCVEQVLELRSVCAVNHHHPIARGDHHHVAHFTVSRWYHVVRPPSPTPSTTASCHVLRLVSARSRFRRCCFRSSDKLRFSSPLLLSCLPPFRVVSSTEPAFLLFDLDPRRLCSFSAVVARSLGVSLSPVSLYRSTQYVLRIDKDRHTRIRVEHFPSVPSYTSRLFISSFWRIYLTRGCAC